MKLMGYTCPHCDAPLKDIEDGRVNFFCSYCGSSLYLDIENNEVKNIVEVKKAEADLFNAKANYEGQKANKIIAETERNQLKDSRIQRVGKSIGGILFIFLGAVIILLVLGGILYILYTNNMKIPDVKSGAFAVIYMILLGGLLAGITSIYSGYSLWIRPVGAERLKIENDIIQLRKKLKDQELEANNLRREISNLGSSFLGADAAKKRDLNRQLKDVKDEIKNTNMQISDLESKLTGWS